MIPRNAKGRPALHHAHGQAQHFRDIWPSVDKITKENKFAAFGRFHREAWRTVLIGLFLDGVTESGEEFDEFLEATVDIPDDVEGTMFVLQVDPERLPLNLSGLNFLRCTQHVNSAKALTLQIAQRSAQLLRLLADDEETEIPIWAIAVSFV